MGGRRGPNISGERRERLKGMAVHYYTRRGYNLDQCAQVLGIGRGSVVSLLDEANVVRRPRGTASERSDSPDARIGVWVGKGPDRRRLGDLELARMVQAAVTIYKRHDGTIEMVAKRLGVDKGNARMLIRLGGLEIRPRGWRQ